MGKNLVAHDISIIMQIWFSRQVANRLDEILMIVLIEKCSELCARKSRTQATQHSLQWKLDYLRSGRAWILVAFHHGDGHRLAGD